MKSYIDFVEKVSKDKVLLSEFNKEVANDSSDELSKWFDKNGFVVSVEESNKIIMNIKTPNTSSILYTTY